MAVNRWFKSNPLNHFMNEKDWTRYQVSTEDGIKLVSELKPKEAKNELCCAIELIEQFTELNQKGLDLLK